MNNNNQSQSAFRCKVEFAAEISKYKIFGDNMGEVKKLAIATGSAIARENQSLESLLLDCSGIPEWACYGASISWHIKQGYWQNRPDLNSDKYFTLRREHAFVIIESRGLNGSSGSISMDKYTATKIFSAARNIPDLYSGWANDPYPVGGTSLLLRINDKDHRYAGQLTLEPDTHPCKGRLYFGDQEHEIEQLSAFSNLFEQVLDMFVVMNPTQDQIEAAEKRAGIIRKKASLCFMPPGGFCGCCGSDVTTSLININAGDVITGCPICGSTWCD
jgi:hypothetical protein